MREIKFRAYHKMLKEMLAPENWQQYGPIMVRGKLSSECCEIMQFTGLHDKNGKEIYEGDVVRDCFGQVNSITFSCGSFWFNWLEMPHYLDQVERGEVIGNRFENPELLKAKPCVA